MQSHVHGSTDVPLLSSTIGQALIDHGFDVRLSWAELKQRCGALASGRGRRVRG